MKNTLTIFLSICFCLLFVIFVSSCSNSQANLIDETSVANVTEKTYNTSGTCNDTVKWKYDVSTSTFSYFGTGKITNVGGIVESEESYWAGIAENIRFEEGITDAEEHTFWSFDKIKSAYIPASYIGTIPKTEYIEKFIVAENNPKYSSDEYGVLFNQDKTEIIRFPKCSPIEFYEIPEGVTNISNDAFKESKNLKTVTVPESLEGISRTTFKESSVYTNPQNWEEDVFYVGDCLVEVDWETKAENIVIREGTRKIEAYAFSRCDNVKSITIPDSVEVIGAQAFVNCSSLEKIYIGSGVEDISGSPFYFEIEGLPCSQLKNIEVSKDNKYFTSVDGVLFSKDMTRLIQYPYGKTQKEYTVPDSVTYIHPGAFRYCNGITKLTIGKGITVIDFIMLFGNDNIETVVLPNTLTKLDCGAFKYSGIKYIDIPDSVTYLGSEAMTGCSRLETINIGKGVSYIDNCAIGSDVLKAVNVDRENKYFTSENGVLYSKDKTELCIYPVNAEGKVYRIPDSVKVIRPGAIGSSNYLEKIYVGEKIEKIGNGNFYSYKNEYYEDYRIQTTYEIYYDGTEKQWNKLFASEYEREDIDKTKIHFS